MRETFDRGMAFMRGIPNTIHYWHKIKKEVLAMTRQLGKPTAFLTLSASAVHWDRLIELLERLRVNVDMSQCRSLQNMPFLDHIELWNNDPGACAIYVNRLFDVILNILKDSQLSPFKAGRPVDATTFTWFTSLWRDFSASSANQQSP
ncbi:hypothetical protein HPB49_016774 [Dermacentor silvarum]|uniref:Uncharacterized protein n=1 Tax=Dermacentor silvarum TaxID=543639 RepID=A0ACB8CAF0_DERSI|nr:hypothetical protein HPB49_016774 [Dermacentor silvarum]